MAEKVRFELTVCFHTPVFKTGAFNHSATSPLLKWLGRLDSNQQPPG